MMNANVGRASCQSPDRKGFTLIELLVVIAIISILATILLPMLSKAKDMAKTVVCANNLSILTKAFHLYSADQDGRMPYPYRSGYSGWHWNNPPGNWSYVLYHAGYKEAGYGSAGEYAARCPVSEIPHTISLGMNDGWTDTNDPTAMPTSSLPVYTGLIDMTAIERPGDTVLLTDVRDGWAWYTWQWGNSFTVRHSGGNNFSFVDGHVSFYEAAPGQEELGMCRPYRLKYKLLP